MKTLSMTNSQIFFAHMGLKDAYELGYWQGQPPPETIFRAGYQPNIQEGIHSYDQIRILVEI